MKCTFKALSANTSNKKIVKGIIKPVKVSKYFAIHNINFKRYLATVVPVSMVLPQCIH